VRCKTREEYMRYVTMYAIASVSAISREQTDVNSLEINSLKETELSPLN
jgi:hypothetical protein